MTMSLAGQILGASGTWQHMAGWGWGWMMLGWLFWLLLIALVVWAVGRFADRSTGRPDPEELLAERFARGELSVEEFEQHRSALRN